MARPRACARKHPLARRAVYLRHTRHAGAYGWSFVDWAFSAEYYATPDGKVFRYMPGPLPARSLQFRYDAKKPDGKKVPPANVGGEEIPLYFSVYLSSLNDAEAERIYQALLISSTGGAFDDEEVAKKRAEREISADSSGGGGGGGGGGESSGGGGGGSSGGGGGGGGDPVLSPPKTVPDTDDKKFWQETWFIATVGTLAAGGVGYGIWRFTRAKKGA